VLMATTGRGLLTTKDLGSNNNNHNRVILGPNLRNQRRYLPIQRVYSPECIYIFISIPKCSFPPFLTFSTRLLIVGGKRVALTQALFFFVFALLLTFSNTRHIYTFGELLSFCIIQTTRQMRQSLLYPVLCCICTIYYLNMCSLIEYSTMYCVTILSYFGF